MKKYLAFSSVLLSQACLLVGQAYAQAPPPSSNPPGAPLDLLAGLLLAAGAGYGIFRTRRSTIQ